MKRQENKENDIVKFIFTRKELKKIKYGIIGLSVIFLASGGIDIYLVSSMYSLKAEDVLFQNQLKIAGEKMDKLSQKADTVSKLSNALKQITQQDGKTNVPGQSESDAVPDTIS